jgi:hypothetical protein
VVTFPAQALDNDDEVVRLVAPGGWVVDETPPRSDAANDARTWQRSPEATDAWTFATGTPNGPNA